ncbi:helix-turn-helix transcriptional regulator [Mucilaginibacter sp. dw_454]|uniref:helix-turn-helix transcriptional regulator n=1 Tax=Mucilaginibacter sp. dw_454 TaxID=2720079 RepID=UPI001BD2020E|nr:helix-turn-helix transcriptional regulator [Mucilaginibacter sp. dw_454]
MNLFNTQMHWLTAVFIIIESYLFAVQLFHFLNQPQDRRRLWYLILLGLLIKFNIANGLFPDPSWRMDIKLQNMIAYGFAYLMGAYFPFYFYKAYRLQQLRFHATWGVFLFLILPYLLFDVILYALNDKLIPDRELGVLIPGTYGLVVLAVMLRAIIKKHKDGGDIAQYRCELLVWFTVLPWEAMSVFAFYPAPQWLRIGLSNLGWLVITILQFEKGIRSNHHRDRKLKELTRQITTEEYEAACRALPISERELDVALLLREELTTAQMAERLFIAPNTVKDHITAILKKTGCHDRKELLARLLTPPPPPAGN